MIQIEDTYFKFFSQSSVFFDVPVFGGENRFELNV